MATQKIKTPLATLEWVTISGEGKENLSGTFQYLASVVLEGSKADSLKATIDDFWAANKPNGLKKKEPKSTGYYPHTTVVLDDEGNPVKDDDGNYIKEETGKTVFVFKTNVTFKDGSTKVVKVFNAKGQEVSLGKKQIGNGSIGLVAGAMGTYAVKGKGANKAIIDGGVSLYLDAIQLKKFVEFTSGPSFDAIEGADDDDFEGFDDGMTALSDTEESTDSDDEPEL